MNAEPLLIKVAQIFNKHSLEVVMIGNSAAALHGAPVTTLDIDFFFRMTDGNMKKLKEVAKSLGAILQQPYDPASSLYRMTNPEEGIQLDFVSQAHGISSFASLRSRAEKVRFGKFELWIASLDDIIASKKSAGRPQDLAVLPILETTKEVSSNGEEES